MDEKQAKFRELAEQRVNNANTEEEVKKMYKTLKEEISVAEAKFKAKGKNNNFKF